MPRSKYPKNIRDKKSSKTNRIKKRGILKSVWPIIKLLIQTLIVGAGAISAVLGILSLFSDISVVAIKPLRQGDLKSALVQITNNSILSIRDVSYICKIRELKTKEGLKVIAYNKGISPSGFIVTHLDRKESSTTSLPFNFVAGPVVFVDFDFVVTYKTFHLSLFTSEKPFRFASVVNAKGETILLKRAVSE